MQRHVIVRQKRNIESKNTYICQNITKLHVCISKCLMTVVENNHTYIASLLIL